jgi:hypothetical protein
VQTQDSANSACQSYLSPQLTAPATAHWHDRNVAVNSNGYLVTGMVDSQNAFGATLTTAYGCDETTSFYVTSAY